MALLWNWRFIYRAGCDTVENTFYFYMCSPFISYLVLFAGQPFTCMCVDILFRGYYWARFTLFIELFSKISHSNFRGAINYRALSINIALVSRRMRYFLMVSKIDVSFIYIYFQMYSKFELWNIRFIH